MNALKCISIMIVLFLAPLFPAYSDEAPAKTQFPWTKDDCVRCHPGPVNARAEAGGKHRNVPCAGCHVGHPPEVKKPIAQCSKCHLKTRKPHFRQEGCLNCHRDPHSPLNISTLGNDVCLTCHEKQVEQLRDNPSKHTALNCSTCHDVHRKIPQCTQCHTPHSDDMAVAECKKCHDPHKPKNITFADDMLSNNCGACHKKVFEVLSASAAKHRTFECVLCHQGKHKTIPDCRDCHGTPHPEIFMAKFPKCGMCHNIAHDLNM
ncbi:MAG: cytochrome C [Nitrospirae bacterium]|nr:cytochrome C [Nitrospirota bacterium]